MKLDPTDTEIYKLEPGDLILAELKTVRRPRWRTDQTSTERREVSAFAATPRSAR